jgi:hypothetical protein
VFVSLFVSLNQWVCQHPSYCQITRIELLVVMRTFCTALSGDTSVWARCTNKPDTTLDISSLRRGNSLVMLFIAMPFLYSVLSFVSLGPSFHLLVYPYQVLIDFYRKHRSVTNVTYRRRVSGHSRLLTSFACYSIDNWLIYWPPIFYYICSVALNGRNIWHDGRR